MKKQLTVFAAAAMLASVASVAMAATKADVTMTGGIEYIVEYNLMDHTWKDKDHWYGDHSAADMNLHAYEWDNQGFVTFTVNTKGNPSLGTVSLNYNFANAAKTTNANGPLPQLPKGTITGTVKPLGDITLKLGDVQGDWDKGGVAWGQLTEGAGAGVAKTFGKTSFEAFTAKHKANSTDAGMGEVESDPVGAKVNTSFNGGSAYGYTVVNADLKGAAAFGADYAVAKNAKVTGKFATTLGDSKAKTAIDAKVEVQPVPGVNALAEVWKVDQGYATQYTKKADDWEDLWGVRMTNLQWIGANQYDKLNLRLNVSADVLKSKDAVLSKATFEYVDFARNEGNNNWVRDFSDYAKVSLNYTPASMDEAFVKFNSSPVSPSTEFGAKFTKGIAGMTFTAQAKMFTISGLNFTDKYGLLKVEKKFDWLTTWASYEKRYNLDSGNYKDMAVPRVGMSATYTF